MLAYPEDTSKRLLLLSTSLSSPTLLPAALLALCEEHGLAVVEHQLTVSYEDMTMNEVLGQILPPGVPVPSSFEQVGHIAHLNLREEQEPFKRAIGEVLLDKNPSIQVCKREVLLMYISL